MRILIVITFLGLSLSAFGEYYGGYGPYGYSPMNPGYFNTYSNSMYGGYYPAYGYGFPFAPSYYGNSDYSQYMYQLQRANWIIGSMQSAPSDRAGEEMVKAGAKSASSNLQALTESLNAHQKALTNAAQATVPKTETPIPTGNPIVEAGIAFSNNTKNTLDGLSLFLKQSAESMSRFMASKTFTRVPSALTIRPNTEVYPRYSLLAQPIAGRTLASEESARHQPASQVDGFSYRLKIPMGSHSDEGLGLIQ